MPDAIWSEIDARLRAYFRRRVADPVRVDDLVQETFARLLAGLPRLRDQEAILPWAYRVARSTLVDMARRARPTEPLDEGALMAAPEGPEDDDEPARVVASWLGPMLTALTPADREVLALTEVEGLSQADLARRLGLSPSGARSKVQRARARLRAELEACCRIDLDRRGHVTGYASPGDCCGPSTSGCGERSAAE